MEKVIYSKDCSITNKPYIVEISFEQYLSWKSGLYIQNACPQLNEDQREFLITGFTPEEWNAVMGPEN